MVYNDPLPGSLKRKRRRRTDKLPVSARLQLDDTLNREHAILSQDLYSELFPALSRVDPSSQTYVALTTARQTRAEAVRSSPWIILPCLQAKDPATPRTTIVIPKAKPITQSLSSILPPSSGSTLRPPVPNSSLQVFLLDAVPLPLDTVVVAVDLENVRFCQQVQDQYGGGLTARNGRSSSRREQSAYKSTRPAATRQQAITPQEESYLTSLVRHAVSKSSLLHTGDHVHLPLPSHPITHTAPEPAIITASEPVTQGFLTPETRIVVVVSQSSSRRLGNRPSKPLLKAVPSFQGPLAELEEDTANEAFHTAGEERDRNQTADGTSLQSTDTDNDTTDLDLSDDPEDVIALASPSTTSHASTGVMSAYSTATPRLRGAIQTPGSVYSSMTTTTVRGGQAHRSKTLQTRGLARVIPDDLLYPTPAFDEDPESRVYVETSILAKIGCFSGDWLELQVASQPTSIMGISHISMNAFSDRLEEDAPVSYRPLKVYALPESLVSKPFKFALNAKSNRRSSISSVSPSSVPVPHIYMSPILLHNLGAPSFVRIERLRAVCPPSHSLVATRNTKDKISPASTPPPAVEVTLAIINTQSSLLRALQPSIFTCLKDYFALKARLLKTGDLIALSIDQEIGKATFDGGTAENCEGKDLVSASESARPSTFGRPTSSPNTVVIWYRVRDIAPSLQSPDELDVWNGLVSVDTTSTKLRTAVSEQWRLPGTATSLWQYYCGVQRTSNGKSSSLTIYTPKTSPMQSRLRDLLSAATSPCAISFSLPSLVVLISSTQRNIGKAFVTMQACADLGLHCYNIDALDVAAESAGGAGDSKSELTLKQRIDLAMHCGAQHTCVLIRHIENIKSERMFNTLREALGEARIVVATTTIAEKLSDALRGLFTHEMEMPAPDESERQTILQNIIASNALVVSPLVDLSSIAIKTAALVAGDLVDVVGRAVAVSSNRLEKLAERGSSLAQMPTTVRDVIVSGGDMVTSLLPADFDVAVESARKNFADSIGAPKIPNVQWSDVGGLANVKDAVMETIQLPLARPELFAKGLKKRSGILFYGPPGTGKTLLAKAIATEFSLNFFSVKGPELLNMYIGESEANVRRVFQRARDARPCVVFFDELDSVAPKRGNQGDSGGVMDRIVSQLLAELDGMSSSGSEEDASGGGGGVFVIAATNRPDLLDQALLRPGRFDKMLYLGISDTHEKQAKILEALTRKFKLDPDLSLTTVASSLPFTFTGADLYALCSDAMLKAITRSAELVDDKIVKINLERAQSGSGPPITIAQFFDHHATERDTDVLVTEADFTAARQELVPSVSAEELGHYERVRREFEGGKEKTMHRPMNGLPSANGEPTAEDVERWQAKRIEQMMTSGFADGSLARNNVRSNSSDGPTTKAKGKARADSRMRYSDKRYSVGGDADNEEEADIVIRTDHLKLDKKRVGDAQGETKTVDHGKGKTSIVNGTRGAMFGKAAHDEGLYDDY